MQAASAILMIAGTFIQASAQRQAGQQASKVASLNAATLRAEGEIEAAERRRESEKLLGAQRARAAASGVEISGTVLDVLGESVETEELNALRIAFRAERAAVVAEQEGAALEAQARAQSAGTLLTSIGRLAALGGTPLGASGSLAISRAPAGLIAPGAPFQAI